MITYQKYLIIGEMTERHIIKPTSRKTRVQSVKAKHHSDKKILPVY